MSSIRGNWTPGTVYYIGDVIMNDGISYLAVYQHMSGSVFETDDADGKWLPISSANDGGSLRIDLASTVPGKGAALVQYDSDETVKQRLDALGMLRTDLANPGTGFGADLVQYSVSQNVRQKLDALVPLTDLTSTVQAGKGIRFKDFFTYPTLDIDDRIFFFHGEGKTAGDDTFSFRIDRRADYDTGTFGFLNSALRINSDITGAGLAFENGLSVIQNNYANAGGSFSTTPQHHAVVVQHNKYGTAPGWCLVLEAIDRTGVANPAQGLGGIELDVQAAGTDSARSRYGITIISRRMGDLTGWTGTANTVGYGIVMAKQSDDAANNKFDVGIGFGRPAATTEFTVGIDFSDANCTVAGIRLANERLDWTADGSRTTRYEPLATALRYEAPAGKTFDLKDDGTFALTGNIEILGSQVITSRRPGWGAPSGTLTRSTFNTGTVTLSQLAERVAAIINDMSAGTGHGLFGA